MSHHRTALFGSLLVGALATSAVACADGNEGTGGAAGSGPASGGQGAASGSGGDGGTGGGEGGQGGSATCDPASTPSESSCVVTDALGIFVSADGDDMAAGTKQAPVRTLNKAMELAQTQDKRVYACAQTFSEAVTVPAGIEIYGGLSCETDWSWVEGKPTDITAAADQVPVVRLFAGDGKTILSDLRVTANDATLPGASSIAVIVDGAEALFTAAPSWQAKRSTGRTGRSRRARRPRVPTEATVSTVPARLLSRAAGLKPRTRRARSRSAARAATAPTPARSPARPEPTDCPPARA